MLDLTDHFLLAMPDQHMGIFQDSLIYITRYGYLTGAVGVIINRPLDKTIKSAFKDINFYDYNPQWVDSQLYFGGPVNLQNGFVLYNNHLTQNTKLDLTNNKAILKQPSVFDDGNKLFISIGYVEWESFQLESEIALGRWLCIPHTANDIFNVDPKDRYQAALNLLGISNKTHFTNTSSSIN